MNFLLVGSDFFYLDGLEIHLSRLFENGLFVKVSELSEEQIAQADIIIVTTYLNKLLLCNEEMLSRRPGSIVIFMVERKPDNDDAFWLPNCIKDAILINDKVNPEAVDNILMEHLAGTRKTTSCAAKCNNCSYQYLTDTQFLIAYAIKHQFSNDKIAKSLGISVNTVLTHLDRLKKKFMLRTTQDIWHYVTSNQLAPMAPIKPLKNKTGRGINK